jgi:hypothetical protein
METKKHEIFVMDESWKLVGVPGDNNTLSDACVVRSWSNGRGIGALATTEYKNEYVLDFVGDVKLRPQRVVFSIPCEW